MVFRIRNPRISRCHNTTSSSEYERAQRESSKNEETTFIVGRFPNKKGRGYEPRPWEFTGYFQTIRISSSPPQPELEECLQVAVIERSKGALFVFHKERVCSKSCKLTVKINLITDPCQATFFHIFSTRSKVAVSRSLSCFSNRENIWRIIPNSNLHS
jgi:hypothetical protein